MKLSPKEKAKELIESFSGLVDSEVAGENGFHFSAEEKLKNQKECALIVASEMINEFLKMRIEGNEHPIKEEYWKDVRAEIHVYSL